VKLEFTKEEYEPSRTLISNGLSGASDCDSGYFFLGTSFCAERFGADACALDE
jgi:hypothetical protein